MTNGKKEGRGRAKKTKPRQPIGPKLSGSTMLKCDECWREESARVVDGQVVLDDEWVWYELKCNWGDGRTLRLLCLGCAENEHGYEDAA